MFKPQFAPLVRTGQKRQTVRAWPKRVPAPGDILDARMWEGRPYASPHVHLGEFKFVRVAPVVIGGRGVLLDGRGVDAEAFAVADGFPGGFSEMLPFFLPRLDINTPPFEGIALFW